MKVVSNLLLNARTTEVGAVANGIIGEFNKGNWSSEVHLTGVLTRLRTSSENLTGAINRIKAESDLEMKDEQRDNNVRAVNFIVSGFIHHTDAAISAAAKKVDAVFEQYGMDILNQSYATESTLINSMLQDFAGVEVHAAIVAIPGLNQMIENLRAAQTAFELAQLIFQEEKASEDDEESATIIKKELSSIINDNLVVYLNAMVQVDEARYGAFAATVAQIIDDMNGTVKKRKKTFVPVNAAATVNTAPKSN